MFEVNPVINQIKEIRERTELLRGSTLLNKNV